MRPDVSTSKALVFGGTGAVGSAVVRGLTRAGVPTVFTYHVAIDKACALAAEHSQRAVGVDLADSDAVRRLIADLDREGAPNIFVHCAATSGALELGFRVKDDYGVEEAYAEIVPVESDPAAKPLYGLPEYKLEIPRRDRRNGRSRPAP